VTTLFSTQGVPYVPPKKILRKPHLAFLDSLMQRAFGTPCPTQSRPWFSQPLLSELAPNLGLDDQTISKRIIPGLYARARFRSAALRTMTSSQTSGIAFTIGGPTGLQAQLTSAATDGAPLGLTNVKTSLEDGPSSEPPIGGTNEQA